MTQEQETRVNFERLVNAEKNWKYFESKYYFLKIGNVTFWQLEIFWIQILPFKIGNITFRKLEIFGIQILPFENTFASVLKCFKQTHWMASVETCFKESWVKFWICLFLTFFLLFCIYSLFSPTHLSKWVHLHFAAQLIK